MTDFNIILFMCNWGPHAAFQTLQDTAARIPDEIKMVRIPCAGRISKALLLRSFEMGAHGVALVGCRPGSCRYGTGSSNAEDHVQDARGILELLGLGKDRLRLATFLPDEPEQLLSFLCDFSADIRQMGPSPIPPAGEKRLLTEEADTIQEIVAAHDVYACQDCGKCSSACPLTLAGKPFSPRGIAGEVIAGHIDAPEVQKDIWACLTCGLCYDRCPSAVDFAAFIRDLRHWLTARGAPGYTAHGGFFQSLMRTMTSKNLHTRHWEWLPEDIRTDPDSKVLFFGGCAPYFDTFFRTHLGVKTRDILVDSLRLLNFFDIHPTLMMDERCCGHDLLWSGDRENFLKLAALNVEAIRDRGIEEVITACPECYHTLATDYPREGIDVGFKVTHIFDLIEKEVDKGAVSFKGMDRRLTFQDPCRLSRFEKRADLPRKLIRRLNPEAFDEMADHGASAICCGNSAWVGCDGFSKALQVKRLRQARQTGSDLLVTACPKCQIHLRCAMEDPFLGEELQMEMLDLTSVLAKTIEWE
jgi:heterodisulfide reductase subunit D